ncbi:phosphatidate cytidylyltransferase [Rhodobacteraceae bacterium HSP-20]|uniref:Phosphatidate cytidylyltransferase n=1 Tax=Paragemmobacter amnigenus TaxID=2852097 RepID=A0ABS6J1T9_9RHOB|nr:phosphatidate cytidylyltransferase [Rhodobacter amnigenus]MBU9696375.1 phosphatidate cytidylyltransferase [Rhodobacter amnigenus]MBV4387602.1 phosphatidate cytidylyltransferase [Rhodobacter amnigenus]
MTAGAPDPGRWGDLRPRVLSAIVMVAVGAAEIWLGGPSFAVLVVLLTAGMIWELATITAPVQRNRPLVMAGIAAAALGGALLFRSDLAAAALLVPSVALALTPRRDRRISAVYAAAIMVAGYGLVSLRETTGTAGIIWLVMVVVMSDVAGYFAGRMIGGPKFWPAVSPKKTWSGTVAGWIGAVVVGLGFVLAGKGGVALLLLSPVVAFAGQMGDVVESWLKRRAGVKDSSHLIPGHGGLLDRFDALIGATVLVMLLGLVLPQLPIG